MMASGSTNHSLYFGSEIIDESIRLVLSLSWVSMIFG
jgi:hypothetical protein